MNGYRMRLFKDEVTRIRCTGIGAQLRLDRGALAMMTTEHRIVDVKARIRERVEPTLRKQIKIEDDLLKSGQFKLADDFYRRSAEDFQAQLCAELEAERQEIQAELREELEAERREELAKLEAKLREELIREIHTELCADLRDEFVRGLREN